MLADPVSVPNRHPIDFASINRAALARSLDILQRWLPDGQVESSEYVSRNPRRADNHTGSFKVNWRTGRWADWSTGDGGGYLIALGAYLNGLTQYETARRMADMLGIENE